MKPKSPVIREQVIETQIRTYLSLKRIFHWKAKTVGTYDEKLGRFRKSAGYMKGISDILGIFNGRLLAIEVKSAVGRLSPAQVIFQDEVRRHGGIAFVARSVSDVQAALQQWRAWTSPQFIQPTEDI